jgi:hypothetical protein
MVTTDAGQLIKKQLEHLVSVSQSIQMLYTKARYRYTSDMPYEPHPDLPL